MTYHHDNKSSILEIDIKPSRLLIIIKVLFVVLVWLLVVSVTLQWWQLSLVGFATLICLWIDYRHRTPVDYLYSKSPDKLWQLSVDGMYTKNERELWQGYLNNVRHLGVALQLDFYVTTPFESRYTLLIFRDSITTKNYRKLAMLAKFGI